MPIRGKFPADLDLLRAAVSLFLAAPPATSAVAAETLRKPLI
jgi:hypothetical protein